MSMVEITTNSLEIVLLSKVSHLLSHVCIVTIIIIMTVPWLYNHTKNPYHFYQYYIIKQYFSLISIYSKSYLSNNNPTNYSWCHTMVTINSTVESLSVCHRLRLASHGLAFLHLARSVENLALILTDGLPNSAELFTFLLALTAWWRGCDDVPNEYVIVVSKTKLAGSIIIQNTRHEITRWWRPPAFTGKVSMPNRYFYALNVHVYFPLLFMPNRRAHARSVLPRWPPWLYWSSLGLFPGVSGKCQDFRPFVDFENFHPLFQDHFTFVKY